MKILFITNIPVPYRVDFFNTLGKFVDLTVIFEAKLVRGISFDWKNEDDLNFKPIFLSNSFIEEKKVDWKILKHIKKNEYDMVVATNYSYYTETVAILKLIFSKIPFVFEIDGGIIRNENKIQYNTKRFLLSKPILYFSPSKSSDECLIHYGADKEKIVRYPFTSVLKNDISDNIVTNEEKAQLRAELGIKEKNIVLYIGQYIYRKGLDVLLNATPYINDKSSTAIILVGGNATKEYEDIINKNKFENIYFVPFQNKDNLSKYLRCADLFVLPTREDVWGLVINEAMAYGLPIITTDKCVSGIELIENEENGYIVQSENSELLGEKINLILDNKNLRDSMASNNLKKISSYTIEEMVKRHIEVFEKIVSEMKNKGDRK